jgi:hypothetical protein
VQTKVTGVRLLRRIEESLVDIRIEIWFYICMFKLNIILYILSYSFMFSQILELYVRLPNHLPCNESKKKKRLQCL